MYVIKQPQNQFLWYWKCHLWDQPTPEPKSWHVFNVQSFKLKSEASQNFRYCLKSWVLHSSLEYCNMHVAVYGCHKFVFMSAHLLPHLRILLVILLICTFAHLYWYPPPHYSKIWLGYFIANQLPKTYTCIQQATQNLVRLSSHKLFHCTSAVIESLRPGWNPTWHSLQSRSTDTQVLQALLGDHSLNVLYVTPPQQHAHIFNLATQFGDSHMIPASNTTQQIRSCKR